VRAAERRIGWVAEPNTEDGAVADELDDEA
jgi:hypothetical protein